MTLCRRLVAIATVCVAVGAGWVAPARATFHTWQIEEIYSSSDGNVQFIELHETSGASGEDKLSGRALTSTQGATTRTFTFPVKLPGSATANKRFLVATQGFSPTSAS